MIKKNISKLTLCVLFLSSMAPFATAKAQTTAPAPITGTDPQPINPNITGTDPQPINPHVISVLLAIVLG